ncbi:MAG TPA: DUF885 domain-containing protein, partial [Acidimicrobiia bacterium]
MDVYELTDRFVEDLARIKPMDATEVGITTYDDRWDNLSSEGHAEVRALLEGYRKQFREQEPIGDRWPDHVRAIALEYVDRRLAWYESEEDVRDLNSVACPIQDFRLVFDIMDLESVKGWETVVARLEGLQAAIELYIDSLEEGRRRGLTAARRQVLAASREAATCAGASSPFGSLDVALASSGVGDKQLQSRLGSAIQGAQLVFWELSAYLEGTYLADALETDGVGRERYEARAFHFVGSQLDLDETYEWGWEQIRELSEQVSKAAAHIAPGRSLPEVMDILKTDPERCAKSPDEFVRIMQERQDRAVDDLAGVHFDIPEQIRRVKVSLAPKGGALGAYYVSPTEDFSRPGSIWYSVGDEEVFPLYDEVSTAYHEGFPGHHLQGGYLLYLADKVGRLAATYAWWSGSGEGWALYAERLMGELGYFEKPDYVLGMLMNHLFRACRVVIDIGSHLGLRIPAVSPVRPGERWSFEAGVEMLTDVAFSNQSVATSEVTRYLGWPGQAIAYKVGERAILELREEL